MKEPELTVGERVIQPASRTFNEPTRHGVVVECYEGIKDGAGRCTHLFSILWDDNQRTERGYIQGSGIEREPIVLATPFILAPEEKP